MAMSAGSRVRTIGRYALHDEIASGGMATVHFGRLLGQAGFTRTVAIKRLHAQYAKDPEFAAMFMDEARLAARIHHPNVVATLDVVARDGELFLVMEYVPGESLSKLVKYAARQGEPIEPRIAVTIVAGFLHGLHAAHEARSERGEPLELVHRDVSPQNVLVGADGVPRVVDFGVAKAIGRVQSTREGQLKGKLSYMSPEQIQGLEVNRRSDVYAASIILWELLAERRLFDRESDAAVMLAVIAAEVVAPSTYAPGVPARLDRITLRGLARNPEERYRTALDMALDLEDAIPLALPSELGRWAQSVAGAELERARHARHRDREQRGAGEAAPLRQPSLLRLRRAAHDRDGRGARDSLARPSFARRHRPRFARAPLWLARPFLARHHRPRRSSRDAHVARRSRAPRVPAARARGRGRALADVAPRVRVSPPRAEHPGARGGARSRGDGARCARPARVRSARGGGPGAADRGHRRDGVSRQRPLARGGGVRRPEGARNAGGAPISFSGAGRPRARRQASPAAEV